jgi:thiaminase/transcriptional activator TenA
MDRPLGFTEQLRKNADHIWEANFNHPFVQGIGKGNLPAEKFIFYLKQDYVYLIDFSRYFALIAARASSLSLMIGFADLLHTTLTTEMELHRGICADFGITPEELEKTEPMPGTLNYTSFLIKSALMGTTGETLAGFLPCAWGYVEIAQRLKKNGLPDEKHYRAWIEAYASDEFDALVRHYRGLLDEYAKTAADNEKNRMQYVFNTCSRLEYMFWEMAWTQKGWPV